MIDALGPGNSGDCKSVKQFSTGLPSGGLPRCPHAKGFGSEVGELSRTREPQVRTQLPPVWTMAEMAVVPLKLPLIQAVSKGCNGSICVGRALQAGSRPRSAIIGRSRSSSGLASRGLVHPRSMAVLR